MYRLLEWAFAYDDGSGLPDAGAYAAELKNVTATADGKPVQGFDPTKTGTWTIPAGTQVNIVDMPDDWKLDGKAEQPAGTVVFTASKYGTPVVTWTFKNDSATDPDKPADPGTDALKNVAATADGKPIAGFDPTRDGAYKVAAGAKVRISDVPSDWKLDKTESGSKLVFTASKGGTAVTWTFEYQANGGSSATDPGNGGGSNAGGDGQGDPGKTPDTSKPAAPTYIRETSWYNFLYKQEVHDDTGRGLQQFQGESQDLHAQGQRGRRHPSRDQRGPGGQRGRHERRRLRFAHGDAARLPEPVSERQGDARHGAGPAGPDDGPRPCRSGRVMLLCWTDDAWADYLYWQSQDRRTLKRVNTLIRDMQRTPFEGIGKPEPLKWGLSGAWSRRIDSANRIIYTVADDRLCILSAKDHY